MNTNLLELKQTFLILEQRVLDEHRQHSIKLHRIYLQHMFHKIHIGIVVTK
jgi:hypothetical protein